ncbi:hypothetical protein NFI96_003418 [Prochilodus magdalenae]|nr:hypothetical protein NFI96_003418 [Prochilodus magdalenae]
MRWRSSRSVERNDTLYWADVGSNQICRAGRDQTWREDVVSSGLGRVEDLAVDWVAGNLYWTDHGLDLIEVCRLNGAYRTAVVSDGLDQPHAIGVHPLKGRPRRAFCLFGLPDYIITARVFDKITSVPGLDRVGPNSKNQQIPPGRLREDDPRQLRAILAKWNLHRLPGPLCSRPLKEGLGPLACSHTFEAQENKLYWCDAGTDKIERISLESGAAREIVLSAGGADMFSLAVFGSYLYWSDRNYANGSIRRGLKNNASAAVTVRSGLGVNLRDVKVFNRDREKGTNPCGRSNGGCEQLCFYLGADRKSCTCSHGYLAEDGLRCHLYEGYLLYSERTTLRTARLGEAEGSSRTTPIRPYENPAYFKNIIALAFDYRQDEAGANRIFFSDVHYGNIQMINDDWTGRRILAESKFL